MVKYMLVSDPTLSRDYREGQASVIYACFRHMQKIFFRNVGFTTRNYNATTISATNETLGNSRPLTLA